MCDFQEMLTALLIIDLLQQVMATYKQGLELMYSNPGYQFVLESLQSRFFHTLWDHFNLCAFILY